MCSNTINSTQLIRSSPQNLVISKQLLFMVWLFLLFVVSLATGMTFVQSLYRSAPFGVLSLLQSSCDMQCFPDHRIQLNSCIESFFCVLRRIAQQSSIPCFLDIAFVATIGAHLFCSVTTLAQRVPRNVKVCGFCYLFFRVYWMESDSRLLTLFPEGSFA